MKRTMTFRFRNTESTVDSASGYYFCELAYRETDDGADNKAYFISYLMTRDYEGFWRITPTADELPSWLYKYEQQFANAIDESIGIKPMTPEMMQR